MIKVLYANPTIDKTYHFAKFVISGTNRPYSSIETGAGKPLNFCSVYKKLSDDINLYGFLFDDNKDIILKRINSEDIDFIYSTLPGKARTNIKIVDDNSSVVTEINEQGDNVNANIDLYFDFTKELHCGDIVVLCGSISKGIDKDLYLKIAKYCSENSIKFFIDAEGKALSDCIKYKPFLIKPNEYEFSLLTGKKFSSINEIAEECLSLNDKAENICVSLGKNGALFCNSSKVWYSPSLDIPVTTTVGAGDAMAAGLIYAINNGYSADIAIRFSTACSASVISGNITKQNIDNLFDISVAEQII